MRLRLSLCLAESNRIESQSQPGSGYPRHQRTIHGTKKKRKIHNTSSTFLFWNSEGREVGKSQSFKKRNSQFERITDRKVADDREVLSGRGLVPNRSKVTGEVVLRLRRIVHELDNHALEPVDELRCEALVGLGIHGHYPFGSYKVVFVDDLPTQRFDSATFSLVTVDLLHGEDSIDQVFETRHCLSHALACQWIALLPQIRYDDSLFY